MISSVRSLLLLMASGAAAVGSPFIYGIGGGTHGPFDLYQVSPSLSDIANTGFVDVLLDFAPNGTLYGAGSDFFFNKWLFTIDPATGNRTLLSQISGLASGFVTQDIAFRSDGTLFAPQTLGVYAINVATASATFLGGSPGLKTLAFSPSGTLYGSDDTNLYTVDQATGAVAFVAALNYGTLGAPLRFRIKFDKTTGVHYGAFQGIGGVGSLATIDLGTGAVKSIAAGPQSFTALAIQPVPEPGTWLMSAIGLAVLISQGSKHSKLPHGRTDRRPTAKRVLRFSSGYRLASLRRRTQRI